MCRFPGYCTNLFQVFFLQKLSLSSAPLICIVIRPYHCLIREEFHRFIIHVIFVCFCFHCQLESVMTCSDGSRHSARGTTSAKRANLICFSVSHVYFFIGGGPKSIAKLDGAWPDLPLLTWRIYGFKPSPNEFLLLKT